MSEMKAVDLFRETATETFMAMSGIGFRNQTLNLNETKNYNTTSVYKWEKYYFDRIQIIDQLSNIVLGFTVEENNFLYLGIDKTRSGKILMIFIFFRIVLLKVFQGNMPRSTGTISALDNTRFINVYRLSTAGTWSFSRWKISTDTTVFWS